MGACGSKKPKPTRTSIPTTGSTRGIPTLTRSAVSTFDSGVDKGTTDLPSPPATPSLKETAAERYSPPSQIEEHRISLVDKKSPTVQNGSEAKQKPRIEHCLETTFFGGDRCFEQLIQAHPPPNGWNQKLAHDYAVQYTVLESGTERPVHQVIIHIDDEHLSTKRSFLAFYRIRPHLMDASEFVDWCLVNKMHNTIADSRALYLASRFYGPGSACLRGLSRDRQVINIQMTDRFVTHKGTFRAIVFQARTMISACRLVRTYLLCLRPADYRTVRCTLPDISNLSPIQWRQERRTDRG